MRFHKIERGRYVLYLGRDWQWGDSALRFEASRSHNFGLGFRINRGDERDLQFSVHCWKLFSFWLTYEGKRLRYRGSDEVTIIGLVWQTREHVIHTQVMDYSGMDSSKPAKINWYWNYRDWLFGRPVYSETPHGRSGRLYDKVPVVMPEATYYCSVDKWTSFWRRPRSILTKRVERIELTPDTPIPSPGKGESDYDQDEDATYSTTMPLNGRTVAECAEDFRQSIIERRERYGGKNWIPEKYRVSA